MKSKKIGILGGTFDPIHFGHINLAIEMLEIRSLDEIWFCPSNVNPFKMGSSTTSSDHRLSMLDLALEPFKEFKILDFELQRPAPSYMIDTINEVLEKHPKDSFWLILGEDTLHQFHHWRKPDEIIRKVPLLVGVRSHSKIPSHLNLETAVQGGKMMQDFELESLTTVGDHSQKVKAPTVISDYGSKDSVSLPPSTAVCRLNDEITQAIQKGVTETRRFDISATDIRHRLQKRVYCQHLLPSKVLDYIYSHGLYS